MRSDTLRINLGRVSALIPTWRVSRLVPRHLIHCTQVRIGHSSFDSAGQIFEIFLRPLAEILPELFKAICKTDVVIVLNVHTNRLVGTCFLTFSERSFKRLQETDALSKSLLEIFRKAVHVRNQSRDTISRNLSNQLANLLVRPMIHIAAVHCDGSASNTKAVLHQCHLTHSNSGDHFRLPLAVPAISKHGRHTYTKGHQNGEPCRHCRPIHDACGTQRRTDNYAIPVTHLAPPLCTERHFDTPVYILEASHGTTI